MLNNVAVLHRHKNISFAHLKKQWFLSRWNAISSEIELISLYVRAVLSDRLRGAVQDSAHAAWEYGVIFDSL